jgi:hypothetical protein
MPRDTVLTQCVKQFTTQLHNPALCFTVLPLHAVEVVSYSNNATKDMFALPRRVNVYAARKAIQHNLHVGDVCDWLKLRRLYLAHCLHLCALCAVADTTPPPFYPATVYSHAFRTCSHAFQRQTQMHAQTPEADVVVYVMNTLRNKMY